MNHADFSPVSKPDPFFSDVLIVGAGITGTALARELSRYTAAVTVLDRGPDVAAGATKANSGIVHAGYDALPGTKKAYYNVRGAAVYESLCAGLCVPFRRCGALVIGFDEADAAALDELLVRGRRNGVEGLSVITGEEARAMEPALNPAVTCALSVPGSAIVSPYELAFALADDAALNGVRFVFGRCVVSAARDENGWNIGTANGETFRTKVFINCAGAGGADLHNLISPDRLSMIHRRGQYYLLDRMKELPFSRTVFQCPSVLGKGVLISPTVHGNLLLGPNAEDVADPLDTATTAEGLAFVLYRAQRTWPQASTRMNITNFSGIRAHLDAGDFVIGEVPGAPGAFEAIGIESPGLSSAPAVAADLASDVASYLKLEKKAAVVPFPRRSKPFSEMTDEERAAAVRKDPAYGNIVCRCETVTEAEIRSAIRRPVGARTVDGVKRRTRAGMGRCQGGFCSPRVAQILSEETGIPIQEITKDGGKSRILCDSVSAFLKGGALHE